MAMNAAVKIEGNEVSLRVTYKIERDGVDIDSDYNLFTEIIGGQYDRTKEEAIEEVIQSAKHFAQDLRDQGYVCACWDDEENYF